MKIAFVHYTIGTPDGVNNVIINNAESLLKLYPKVKIAFVGSVKNKFLRMKRRVRYIDIPELDISKQKQERYSKNDVFEYLRNGERIKEKLNTYLSKYHAVIFENPTLGVNPAATYGFYRFIKQNAQEMRRTKTMFRLHDFIMDRKGNFTNILKFAGREANPYWHKIIFPKRRNFSYTVINSSDVKLLKSHGIVEDHKVHYLPNPINEKIYYEDDEYLKLKELLITKFKIDPEAKIIYYPVRIVPRKNIVEAILLMQLLNIRFGEKFHLIVSRKTTLPEGIKYCKRLQKFIDKHKLPVTLGLENIVDLTREQKKGKIIRYSVGDMYKVADKIISTSSLEGFGLFFIEAWFFNKAIIGRDLPNTTPDFTSNGVNLEHLYSALFIDKIDFKDYPLKDQLKFILKIKDQKFREKFIEINKHAVFGTYRIFNPEFEEKLIKDNRNQVIKNYSSELAAQSLMKAINETV